MLKLIIMQIDSDTIVGMDSLKAQLESMKLHDHGNDIGKMLMKMQGIYRTLKENGHTPDSYRQYIYTALASGPNTDFNLFMQRMIDGIQSSHGYHRDIDPDKLIVAARTKYNNMVEDKTWGRVDPRNAKIMALTTKIKLLEKTTSGQSTVAANVTNGKTGGPTDSKFSILE